MDKNLVYYKDKETHAKYIAKVLLDLLVSSLRLNPSKCELYKDEVYFLGNVVLYDSHVILPDKAKLSLSLVKISTKRFQRFFGIGKLSYADSARRYRAWYLPSPL